MTFDPTAYVWVAAIATIFAIGAVVSVILDLSATGEPDKPLDTMDKISKAWVVCQLEIARDWGWRSGSCLSEQNGCEGPKEEHLAPFCKQT